MLAAGILADLCIDMNTTVQKENNKIEWFHYVSFNVHWSQMYNYSLIYLINNHIFTATKLAYVKFKKEKRMKRILLVLAVVSSAMMADAQECTWGIKGGIDMTFYKLGVEDVSLKINSGNKTGFYLGVVNNFKFAEQWGVQTELLYNYAGAKIGMGEDFINAMNASQDPAAESVNTGDMKISYNTHTLRLPILAKFQPVGGLSVLAGPYFAFRMGGKLKPNDNVEALIKGAMEENSLPEAIKYDDIKDVCSDLMADNLKKFDVGATLGIEYAFKNGLFIDAHYNISFINKLKKDLDYSAFADYVNGFEGMEGTISGETSVKMKDTLGVQPKIRYSSVQFGIGFRF